MMEKITAGPLKVKSALLVMAAGLVTGILMDRLAFVQQPGIGLVIATLSVVVGFAVAGRVGPDRWETLALAGGAAVLVAWGVVRSADYLITINLLSAALLLSLAVTARAYNPRIWLMRGFDHIRSWVDQMFAMLFGAIRPFFVLIKARAGLDLAPIIPYLRGAVFALPVFAVFALLLASADAVFSDFLGGVIPDLNFTLESTAGHLLVIALIAWVAIGFFAIAWETPIASGLQGGPSAEVETARLAARRDRFVEVMVVLTSVAALFLLFVAFQFAYLFGGGSQIVAGGTTYAEYAREGFFQLLAVSALTGAMVWVATLWLRPLTGRRRAIFRAVCALMVALTGVILASALKRLGLYEDAYGYTRLRVLSHVFTLWVAAMLVVLLAEIWTERPGLLPGGAVALGFVVLFGLNLMNPDAYIAERNLARDPGATAGGEPADYVTELSPDAIPVAMRHLASVDSTERRRLTRWACNTMQGDTDWRSASLGRARARSAMRAVGLEPGSARCHLAATS